MLLLEIYTGAFSRDLSPTPNLYRVFSRGLVPDLNLYRVFSMGSCSYPQIYRPAWVSIVGGFAHAPLCEEIF